MGHTLTLDEAKRLSSGTILYHTRHFNKKGEPDRWKVNGAVKTWKRDASRVQVPVKHGLYAHGYVTENDLELVTLDEEFAKDQRGV